MADASRADWNIAAAREPRRPGSVGGDRCGVLYVGGSGLLSLRRQIVADGRAVLRPRGIRIRRSPHGLRRPVTLVADRRRLRLRRCRRRHVLRDARHQKRPTQFGHRALIRALRAREAEVATQGQPTLVDLVDVPGFGLDGLHALHLVGTVSYTHLDVYKRQTEEEVTPMIQPRQSALLLMTGVLLPLLVLVMHPTGHELADDPSGRMRAVNALLLGIDIARLPLLATGLAG